MLKKKLQLMIAGQTLKKRLQLMTALTILMLCLIIAVLLEPQFKLSAGIVLTLICAAYVEYHRRKLYSESSRYTDTKLGEQARKFRGELFKTIQTRAWGDDKLDALMGLIGEFFKISPFDESRHKPPEQVED